MAVVATIAGREAALRRCLLSLRPQVDELRVVFHDCEPSSIELIDSYERVPDIHGSAAKLYFAGEWQGLYLGCDDDIAYPRNYVEVMYRWVKRWRGKALVTCHGRILHGIGAGFKDQSFAGYAFAATDGGWLNYPGGCALAFDTRLEVPAIDYVKNCEEAGLAVWAQRNTVPIWLVPHVEGWLTYLGPEGRTIWAEEKGNGFERRNAVLRQHTTEWQVHKCR